MGRTIVTHSAGFMHGRGCGLWRSQSLLSPQGTHFILSFSSVWEAKSFKSTTH